MKKIELEKIYYILVDINYLSIIRSDKAYKICTKQDYLEIKKSVKNLKFFKCVLFHNIHNPFLAIDLDYLKKIFTRADLQYFTANNHLALYHYGAGESVITDCMIRLKLKSTNGYNEGSIIGNSIKYYLSEIDYSIATPCSKCNLQINNMKEGYICFSCKENL